MPPRGRPKKDASASDTDDETPKPKAKRGRPKKVQEVVETDDLISKLVKKVVIAFLSYRKVNHRQNYY